MTAALRLPDPCVVVLVGASGAGKTHWARTAFDLGYVVASDDLRAVVGLGPDDQRAGTDAFDLLELILDRRCRRGLTTVVDSTGLDARRRAAWLRVARQNGVPAHVVLFATADMLCRSRNRDRSRPVPAKVLTTQLRQAREVSAVLAADGWDGIHAPGPVTLVPPQFLHATAAANRQQEDPMDLDFGLQISRFDWPGGTAETAERLAALAGEAEAAGFTSLWVMDHFLQIPTVGREWEGMLDSYTTLGFLAGRTTTARLGVLVTGVTYRNLAHLAKIVATLDVLSGGRAMCGLGAAWFKREHDLYDWEFPPVGRRYDLLEDALELLPLMWGPGSPRFEGRTTTVPAATCYPRPLQERVPIWVGGSGERRTLRLAARYADGCNLFGDPATVRRKVEVLRGHCADAERDPATVRVTHLSTGSVVAVGQARPHPDAGTVDEQVGRYRDLAEAGVQTAIVALPELGTDPGAIARFAEVVGRFPRPR
ncbi:MAG: TIGR03560 family F420-dependent LLM class oxidoreductase [Acidimicrobiales bacterium]